MKKRTKKYNEFINYGEALISIKEGLEVLEMAINPEKLDRVSRLKKANDIKGILNLIQPDIDRVVNLCKNINFDEIEYFNDEEDTIEINYNLTIFNLLNSIKIAANQGGEEILSRIFPDEEDDMLLKITIDRDLFNRIDIINSMPNFIKKIGLGKKIYKKLIKDFGYLSTFNGFEPSTDSSMVWNSIVRDVELFSFIDKSNIISFWNRFNYNEIIDKLIEFYKNDRTSYQFDDNFLDRYNLTEEQLCKLIFK